MKPAMNRLRAADFVVLAFRWYLAFYMVSYGWGKMNDGQFIVHDPAMLDRPMKELDTFYIAWYLFGQSKLFNVVVGMSQLIGAALIVVNRTVVAGALFLLPILVQIFLIDASFSVSAVGPNLSIRLGGMIMTDLIILWYYRERLLRAWENITNGPGTRYAYPLWIYPLMIVVGFLTDFVWAVLLIPVKALFY